MKKTLPVTGMACSACSAHVEETLRSLEGVSRVSVSLLMRTAAVEYDESRITVADMKKAVNAAGYDIITDEGVSAAEVEKRSSRVLARRTLAAWLCAAAVTAVSMRWISVGDGDARNQTMLLLALLSMVACGRGFYVSAFKNALHMRAGMDTLVAFSTGVTFLFSAFNTFFGDAVWGSRGIVWHTYFDTPTMILAFVLAGRWMEERAKEGTTGAVRELMGISPKTAVIVREDENGIRTTGEIPISTIRRGDLLRVGAGMRVPADGCVEEAGSFMTAGSVYVDESMLTGEPAPVEKKKGSHVYAGTVVSQGTCLVEARLTGRDTALEKIISLVGESLERKTPAERAADRVSAVFAPAVLCLALLTFLLWWAAGGTARLPMAVMSAMAVVVIACPCAMGLATPTAVMVGIGKAAGKHILIKDASALETLRRMNALVTDKTGTLTIPNPSVDFTRVGSLGFEERETLRPGAREMTEALRKNGTEVYMTSGDTPQAAGYWAEKAGIRYFSGCASHGDKEKLVGKLKKEGKTVGMLGDGINDTGALAAADVSIAVGKGTDVAVDLAQIVIMGDDLSAVAEAAAIGRSTSRLIRQNLFWAFVYNIVSIPLAAGLPYAFGIHWSISPMWAAALMALSSVSVVLNSLRLKFS